MYLFISVVSGVLLMLLAAWLLVGTYKQVGSITRSFGFGAFFMALAAWFNYSRLAGAPYWFTPVFGLAGVLLLGLMIHFFRLMRRLSYGEPRPDILDVMTDGIISKFLK
ncbi:MAG: hypothetical protein K0R39_1784 [Symbiobacteriaceae bacterium]|jgi:hypothetical protein|nr:hypothetical protein [Symbiobacteriaceae bacterium]